MCVCDNVVCVFDNVVCLGDNVLEHMVSRAKQGSFYLQHEWQNLYFGCLKNYV